LGLDPCLSGRGGCQSGGATSLIAGIGQHIRSQRARIAGAQRDEDVAECIATQQALGSDRLKSDRNHALAELPALWQMATTDREIQINETSLLSVGLMKKMEILLLFSMS
jgi:hypothetical protein